jgi:DNA-binding protein YbaB
MDADEARLKELDKFVHESERSMRELAQAMDGLRQLTGTGESRTRVVSAQVDADGRLAELDISARAMKLGNRELSREVIEAVTAAQLDLERQAKALTAFVPDQDGLLETFQRDLAEVQDSYTAETHERLDRMRQAQRRRQD